LPKRFYPTYKRNSSNELGSTILAGEGKEEEA
jgi:hypothetical protein